MATTKTPINSIEIPAEYLALCGEWYSGQADLMYAVSSTGGLTLSNRRPIECDTDEKWYLSLWQQLSGDIAYASEAAHRSTAPAHDDYDSLVAFGEWVDEIVERLAEEYVLLDWAGF